MAVGSPVKEWFGHPYNAYYTGRIVRMPTERNPTIKVTYSDNTSFECQVEEVRANLDITKFPMWEVHINKLKPAFAYLEARLTNNCEAAYHCAELYTILALVRMFNPLFAAAHLAADAVDGLSDIPSLVVLISKLKREVPAYLVAARG
eukprot:5998100-Prymnesium_polylepis.1